MAGTGTKRITELTEASTIQNGDFIAVDSNARGTKKVSTDTLATSAALTAETNARAGADEAEAQAREAADNTLGGQVAGLKSDLSDITEAKYGKNRFDINAVTNGYYLGSNGELIAHSSWSVSDYCYVKGFTNVICSNKSNADRYSKTMFYLCTYDEGKRFIEKIGDMPSYPITLGENVAYIRFALSGTPTAEEEIQVESGTSFTAFAPYRVEAVLKTDNELTNAELPANAKAVGDALKNIEDVREFEAVTLSMIEGKLLNASTGAITDSPTHSGWQVSDFVEIEPNSKVMVTTQHFFGQGLYAFYDKNQNYISGLASNNENARTRLYNQIVDTPSNAKYIVIGFLLESGAFDAPYLFEGIKQSAIPSQIWNGRKWAVIGDSLTANNSRTSMHYFDYIKGYTGIAVVNLGLSGTGYATANPFYDRVDDVPLDSNVVTMFGSFNDLATSVPLGTKTDSGTSTIGGCINKAIDDLFTAFPLANLGIVTPTPWAGQSEFEGSSQGIAYVELIKDICHLRGIPCLDLFHDSGLRPWNSMFRTLAYSKDDGNGVHPDEVGHKIIAPKIEAFLNSLLLR